MLRSGPLEGLKLQSYLYADEDREKFESMLCEDMTTATVRHVDMVDANGSQIKVELFGISFVTGTAELKYLMGIKEYGDDSWARTSPASAVAPQVAVELQNGSEAFDRASSVFTDETDRADDVDRAGEQQVWKHTSTKAIDASLILLMRTWKCRPIEKQCCEIHMACTALKRATKRISMRRCIAEEFPATDQCAVCGILGGGDLDVDFTEDEECLLCPHIDSFYPRLVEVPSGPGGKPPHDSASQKQLLRNVQKQQRCSNTANTPHTGPPFTDTTDSSMQLSL